MNLKDFAMNIIATDTNVIEILSNNESLISGKLVGISIYTKEHRLQIDLNIELMYSKKMKNIKLQFIGVSEYSFSYSSDNYFYNIETYKFFKEENIFYISLDPSHTHNDESNIADNDYMKAENIILLG